MITTTFLPTTTETMLYNINNDIGELAKLCSHIQENDENLKRTMIVLETNVNKNMTILGNNINVLETEIVGLKQENVELKHTNTTLTERVNVLEIENVELKQEVVGLKQEVVGLKQEVVGLKQEVVGLKQEIVGLKHTITLMAQKEIKNKIITSITDLNGADHLEKKLETPFNLLLIRIRNNRNHINHYIYDDDTKEVCDRKKWFLLSKLKKLTDEEKTKLNRYFKHKDFINRIIVYLENLHIEIEPDEEEDDYIRDWWGDL